MTYEKFEITDRTTRNAGKVGQTRVYVSPSQNESVMDHLINRHNRPWQDWKPVVRQALLDHGIEPKTISWNCHAGCTMCPCSGGFILDRYYGPDIWITI